LGLGYPGGPNLQALAMDGDPFKYKLPRSFKGEDHLDFSFSGLKTAIINMLHRFGQAGEAYDREDVAASFMETVADTLAANSFEALRRTGHRKLAVCGGVSANAQIRAKFEEKAAEAGARLFFPSMEYCTDNAVMIASAAYYAYVDGKRAGLELNAEPVVEMGTI